MNFSRPYLALSLTVLLAAATAGAGVAQSGSGTPSPSPLVTAQPTPVASPLPSPTPSSGPQRGRRANQQQPGGVPTPAPKSSDTPEPPQFTTLDGIWEVELQPIGHRLATYTHLSINTTGADIIGYYQRGGKNAPKFPMTGNFDGRLISLNVTLPDKSTVSFNGYVEAFGDMVGLMRTSDKDPGTAFTAEHRKKIKT